MQFTSVKSVLFAQKCKEISEYFNQNFKKKQGKTFDSDFHVSTLRYWYSSKLPPATIWHKVILMWVP